MARPIVLSNGELHVGLNAYGLVHDFYFPYVGLENHAAGNSLRHRVGIWVDGQVNWLDDGDWILSFSYPHHSLIGHTTARNDRIGIIVEFDDAVDSSVSAFMRNIHVINLRNETRDVRLFMHQAFIIGDARSHTDTAQYLPDSDAILHYRGRRAFIISGDADGQPFDQHTVGLFGIEGYEGSYRDADDGELSGGNVEHGQVDSAVRFSLALEGLSSKRVNYWVAAGTSLREALYVHKTVREGTVHERLRKTSDWWHVWLKPALNVSEKIDPAHRENFLRSVMIIKSQIDNRGAVIASTDTTMLNYSRDAYGYCWPRDGAHVLWPLIRMGYEDEPRRFFDFCRRGLHPSGYLMHKYRADGALGSSWHPYVHDQDTNAPPIQEDETALVLVVFAQFYQMHASPRLIQDFYEPMVKPMADFMAGYIDQTTGLPKPTYDLWEENFLTTTYTTSLVYAALLAAADLAEDAKDSDSAVRWRSAAGDILTASHKYLYNSERKAFYKGLLVKDGTVIYDDTIDMSSIFGVFMFGLFELESEELQSAVATATERFEYTSNIGLPRYENDKYFLADQNGLGNWWTITSLWMAQYHIEMNQRDQAKTVLDWVLSHSSSTGILPEQINPLTGAGISVAPLTWSHAEYVAALLDIVTEKK